MAHALEERRPLEFRAGLPVYPRARAHGCRPPTSLFPEVARRHPDHAPHRTGDSAQASCDQGDATDESDGPSKLARRQRSQSGGARGVTGASASDSPTAVVERASRPLRLAVIVNMVAPYTRPLFEQLARAPECELLVVSETTMERDRRW